MANTFLRMQTDLGGIDLELFENQVPLTVTIFLNYVNRSDCDGTFIHRSVPGFVIQGGGYILKPDDGDVFGSDTSHIPVDSPVVNEPDPVNRPNVHDILAMARTSDPVSATISEINATIVTLHFVDGTRGDSDLKANGANIDPGAPAQKASISGASGGGGGCSLIGQSGNPAQVGTWWLLVALIALLHTRSAGGVLTR